MLGADLSPPGAEPDQEPPESPRDPDVPDGLVLQHG